MRTKAKKTTLYGQLSRQILPRVIAALVAFCLVLSFIFIYLAQSQLEQQHQSYAESFKDGFITNLDKHVLLVTNLAENDLILNGLFDNRTREEFLPLFFQGLQLNNDESVSTALYDFEGNNVLSRDWSEVPSKLSSNVWEAQVFEELRPFINIDKDGVFVVAPITYENMAEGALAVYSRTIDTLFTPNRENAYQILFSAEGQLIYTNYAMPLAEDLVLNDMDSAFDKFFFLVQHFDEYSVASVESYRHAYEYSLWILPLLLFALTMAIGLSFFSSRSAANVAAKTLHQLHNELNNQINNVHLKTAVNGAEAVEIREIRDSFTKLKEKTLSLSLKNNKINNVINSLKEFLIVINNQGETILTNKKADDFFNEHPYTPRSIQQKLQDSERHGESTIQLHSGTNTTIWRTFPMLDGSGSVIAGEDITRQLKLEEDLKIRTKAIEVATSPFVISDVSDPEQPIVYANQAFFDLTGYSKEESIGRNCRFLQGKNTTEKSKARLRDAIQKGENLRVKVVNYRKNGTEFINELTLTGIPNEHGIITHYIGAQRDITKRELTAKYLADAKRQAEDFARIQKRFFANMNHELRTPINGIKGMLNALQKGELDNEQTRFVDIAERSAENLLMIVNDILEFSKAESGGIELESSHFNLNQLIEDMRDNYAIQCREKNLQFIFKSDLEEALWVKADALRLQQIMQNLLNNALKFTQEGSIHLNVKVKRIVRGMYEFSCKVVDTGIGLSEQQQEKVFDAFAQASASTSRNYGGTGLGLSICKQLAKLMGGEVSVHSEENKGSVFSFFVRLMAGQKPPSVTSNIQDHRINKLTNPPVVLIAEDNEINQVVLLENLSGVKAIVANNGEKAIEVLKTAKVTFDVILMDNEMPEMDGVTATKFIRSGAVGEKYANIPIIAVTAHAMEEDEKRFIGAGMSDYISKPINPELLNDRILHWTAIQRAQQAATLQVQK